MSKRKIKFRVWDSANKSYIKNPDGVRINAATGDVHGFKSQGNVDHWMLQQFTGES